MRHHVQQMLDRTCPLRDSKKSRPFQIQFPLHRFISDSFQNHSFPLAPPGGLSQYHKVGTLEEKHKKKRSTYFILDEAKPKVCERLRRTRLLLQQELKLLKAFGWIGFYVQKSLVV